MSVDWNSSFPFAHSDDLGSYTYLLFVETLIAMLSHGGIIISGIVTDLTQAPFSMRKLWT